MAIVVLLNINPDVLMSTLILLTPTRVNEQEDYHSLRLTAHEQSPVELAETRSEFVHEEEPPMLLT